MTIPTEIALEILVDGFFDNPVMAWIFPDETTRAEALEAWFRFWIDLYGERGVIEVSSDGTGAALWATPDTPHLAGDDAGPLVEVVQRYAGDRTGLVFRTLGTVGRPTGRHWYLNAIAARRGARARGVGARLLEPYLARSEAEGVPIYLESSNPRNLTFYRRYGFEDYGPRVDLPDSDTSLQPMWRDVSSGSLDRRRAEPARSSSRTRS